MSVRLGVSRGVLLRHPTGTVPPRITLQYHTPSLFGSTHVLEFGRVAASFCQDLLEASAN